MITRNCVICCQIPGKPSPALPPTQTPHSQSTGRGDAQYDKSSEQTVDTVTIGALIKH